MPRIADARTDAEKPTLDLEPALGDLRFRSLLSPAAWADLPASVRARFSKRLANGATAVYVGRVTELYTSAVGRLLVLASRLIGSPFPTGIAVGATSIVAVTEHAASGGQTWTRLYTRRNGFPQVIHSVKQFAGPTGLEEHVGRGIGMCLTVSTDRGALSFRSDDYFVRIAGWRITLPRWATPGALTVTHREVDGESFVFSLEIVHPLFGRLLRQSALFRNARRGGGRGTDWDR